MEITAINIGQVLYVIIVMLTAYWVVCHCEGLNKSRGDDSRIIIVGLAMGVAWPAWWFAYFTFIRPHITRLAARKEFVATWREQRIAGIANKDKVVRGACDGMGHGS